MKVKDVSRQKLLSLLDSGERFNLVDVLPHEHFTQEHIEGAISLPVDEIGEKSSEILQDKGEKIVVYCASFECPASTNAAGKLLKLGYRNVLDYKGGLKDYKQTNRQLQGSLHKKSESVCRSC